jgi:hypothetical protein
MRWAFVPLFAALCASCSNPDTDFTLPPWNNIRVDVEVIDGDIVFAWDGGGVRRLVVSEPLYAEGGGSVTPLWTIDTEGNAVLPTVVYGTAPEGASDTFGAEPLESGIEFEVRLHRDLPEGRFEAGWATFVAP